MPDEPKSKDPGAVWRDQPEEKTTMHLGLLVNRRTRELQSRSRLDILVSLFAAIFLVAVTAWRFALMNDRIPQIGLIVVVAWVLITLYRFRGRIWRRESQPADAVASAAVQYYRKELEHRRDHLRNVWLWHGPLLLACLILVATLARRVFPNVERLRNMLPFLILLAIWIGLSFWLRRKQVRDIQREIEEIDQL